MLQGVLWKVRFTRGGQKFVIPVSFSFLIERIQNWRFLFTVSFYSWCLHDAILLLTCFSIQDVVTLRIV